MVHLLIDLDSAFADSMLEELLQKDVHIPLFYENKESALSCAIAKGKAKVVRLLLKYYCRRTTLSVNYLLSYISNITYNQ